ncbi:RING finger protein 122 isoform X1 [Elephas maximus indicus]|uniref:RING finger protein 122 isoform X1 n=1 Tax=Elephas maximus indicus TaxID=99487 RepID=UPI002116A63D|nr:RING finger protein 122 isoform X1 [Elephas maximus indicus]
MHPFQWCNGCFCGLGLVSTNKSCSMPPISFQDLPLNIYMVIFGTGIFVFMLSLIFCCYFISKLRNQAQSERYGYKEVVLKGDVKKLQLYGVSVLGQHAGGPQQVRQMAPYSSSRPGCFQESFQSLPSYLLWLNKRDSSQQVINIWNSFSLEMTQAENKEILNGLA